MTVNHLRDPAGMPPHPTMTGHNGTLCNLGEKSVQTQRDIPDVLRHIIKNVSERLFRIILTFFVFIIIDKARVKENAYK